MSWYTVFYIMSIADNISTFANVIAVIASVSSIVSFIIKWNEELDENERSRLHTWLLSSVWFMIFFWMLFIIIPSKKDMLLIVAGGAIGEFVSNDENARQIPTDLMVLFRKEILEATVDLDEDTKKLVKDKLGIESEVDKLKKLSKEELIEMLNKKTP